MQGESLTTVLYFRDAHRQPSVPDFLLEFETAVSGIFCHSDVHPIQTVNLLSNHKLPCQCKQSNAGLQCLR